MVNMHSLLHPIMAKSSLSFSFLASWHYISTIKSLVHMALMVVQPLESIFQGVNFRIDLMIMGTCRIPLSLYTNQHGGAFLILW